MTDDPYAALGVPKDASTEAIKAAFKGIAKKTHPDTGNAPNTERFAEASSAYKLLTDQRARKHYDETGQRFNSSLSDPVHDRVVNLLASIFEQVIGDENALFTNIPFLIESRLKGALVERNQHLSNGEKELRKTETARKRLRRKKKTGTDYLNAMASARIDKLKTLIANVKLDRDAAQRAIELLDGGYDFEVEIKQQVQFFQMRSGPFSGTTT